MSVMLAAADLGIGSAHTGVQDQELARRLLGVPEDRFCAVLITLGTPADRPLTPLERPARRPFDEVVHRGQWWRTTPLVVGAVRAGDTPHQVPLRSTLLRPSRCQPLESRRPTIGPGSSEIDSGEPHPLATT
jgi:hypothetical protein